MNHHPHLRAYLAGTAFPTLVLPLFLLVYLVGSLVFESPFPYEPATISRLASGRVVFECPVPFERVAVFPLAIVPILWGAWNVLYFRLGIGKVLPLGVFGAVLVAVLAPVPYFGAQVILHIALPASLFWKLYPAALLGYYLLWKYVVAFFNRALGLA
jgi:hypothetical protein